MSLVLRGNLENGRTASAEVKFIHDQQPRAVKWFHKDVVNSEKSASEGQGDENTDAVRSQVHSLGNDNLGRGLDNAGKTTIVKRIMKEDVSTVSPTLGFIIKTIEYEG